MAQHGDSGFLAVLQALAKLFVEKAVGEANRFGILPRVAVINTVDVRPVNGT